MKDEARILDATSGNKTMWKKNESDKILWIDIEEELEYAPDILMDCTNTDFNDGRFHTIFFDPPHEWGRKKYSNIFTIPNRTHPNYAKYKLGGGDTYYGWDKYETKSKLLMFISKSQNEFYRILSNDGCLWVKWNEYKIKVSEIIPLFLNWDLMMRTYGTPPRQESQTKTYWLLFMKKENKLLQSMIVDGEE